MTANFEENLSKSEKWHIGKEIPLAVLFAIFIQCSGIVWFGATISTRMLMVETRLDTLNDSRDRLVRLEAAAIYQSDALGEIKDELKLARGIKEKER